MFKNKAKESATRNSKIAVFIDAGNLWGVYKAIGRMLELKKLSSFFSKKFEGDIFKIFYYVAYPPEGTRPGDKIKRFHNFLVYLEKGLNFCVIKKALKTINLRDKEGRLIYDQESGEPQTIEKGNLDVELTIDAIKYSSAYDIAVLITGDSDFLSLASYLRNLKQPKRVYVFSTDGSISSELRTGTDGYFDIADFSEIHGDELKNSEDR